MTWTVIFAEEFDAEMAALPTGVRRSLLAHAGVLEVIGPTLGRPLVDTLYGSRFDNMKELRFSVEGGMWRAAFAFDPNRQAIVLVAGNKTGKSQSRFYKTLVATADSRYARHLEYLED